MAFFKLRWPSKKQEPERVIRGARNASVESVEAMRRRARHRLIGASLLVLAAILAYALSMLSWLLALRDLPLGRAYSLLSISYALVYLLAASLPLFHEDFSLSKSLGVALVILGVITINSRPASAPELRNAS